MTQSKLNKLFTKQNKNKISCLTAYTFNLAKLIDGQVDLLLVGDSLGMVLYGHKNTRLVTDQMMIDHTKAVKKASKKSIVFFDLPYSKNTQIKNLYERVVRISKETSCKNVKIEGGHELVNLVKKLNSKKINVMVHLGLKPQKYSSVKKFKIFGRKSRTIMGNDRFFTAGFMHHVN